MQDTKKVQTLINAAAESIIAARNISNIRAKFKAASPSINNTPLAGNGSSLNAWLDSLESILADPMADLLVNNKVKSHKGNAL